MAVYVGNTRYSLMSGNRRATFMPDFIRWKEMSVIGIAPFYIEKPQKIDAVKFIGKCEQEHIQVWNQLVYNADFSVGDNEPTGWSTSYGTTFDNTDPDFVVVNGSNYIFQMSKLNGISVGHVYYVSVTVKYTGPNTTGYVYLPEFDTTLYRPETDMSWTDIEIIKTARNAGTTTGYGIFRIMNSNSGIAIDKNKGVQMIDLTLLYGAGNEPETVQDFKDSYEEMFGHPLTYEPYNPGTVLERKDIVCSNGALSIGKNFADISFPSKTVSGVQFRSENQSLKVQGTITGSTFANFSLTNYATAANLSLLVSNSSGVTKFGSGKTYSVSFSNSSGIYDMKLVKSDLSGSTSIQLSNGSASFTPSSDCCDLWVRYNGTGTQLDIETTVQIEESPEPTYYEPFGVYPQGITEKLNIRNSGMTPLVFQGYVATATRTGLYSYDFSWNPASSNMWNGITASNVPIVLGHKYYYCADMMSSTPANLSISFGAGLSGTSKGKSSVVPDTEYTISNIQESTASSDGTIMYIRMGYAEAGSDYTGYARNIGLFDLTEIFGQGNEPETISDARHILGFDNSLEAGTLLSCGSYKDIQEISTGGISRNVGIKILNGTERFALDNWRPYDGTYAFALYKNELPGILEASTNNVICTHFNSTTYSGAGGVYYGGTGINIYSNNGDYSVFIRVPNGIATSAATMKAWLAQQHANGTPVTIVYPLGSAVQDHTESQTMDILGKNTCSVSITQSSLEDMDLQVDYKVMEDKLDYCSFTANASGSSVSISRYGSIGLSVEWSRNKTSWFIYEDGDVIQIPVGETIYLRNSVTTVKTGFSTNTSNYCQFVMTGSINGGGNIMSLLDKSCETTTVGNYCFYRLFRDCTALKTSPKLPATSLGTYCYYQMFHNAGLTVAPVLPATVMANYCYYGMFYNCKFTVAPELPSTQLANYCYYYMFTNCTSMTVAPELPATVLTTGCYYQMFYQCFGLTSFPRLQFTTMASNCFNSMFLTCRNITSYHLSSLNTSGNVFSGNSGCTSLTIDAVEPPTIGSNTITGLKSDCIIYVPAESVDAYKAKQYWSARAAYIQAMP